MQQKEEGCEGNPFSTLLKWPQDTVFKELSHVRPLKNPADKKLGVSITGLHAQTRPQECL